MKRRTRGFIGEVLKAIYLREIKGGGELRWPFPLTEREGEESGEKMVLTCGAHTSPSGRENRGYQFGLS
jgi:hypothetical protein